MNISATTLDELLARESIHQTIVSYTMAGDRLREDEFVAVFTDDAVLESDGVPDSARRWRRGFMDRLNTRSRARIRPTRTILDT